MNADDDIEQYRKLYALIRGDGEATRNLLCEEHAKTFHPGELHLMKKVEDDMGCYLCRKESDRTMNLFPE